MDDQKWQFERGGLLVTAIRTNGKGTVTLQGTSDSRTPGAFLRPILQDLSDKLRGAAVTVDFSGLEYLNSATVAPLITFVKTLDSSCPRIVVWFSEAHWQRIHLLCMRAIAMNLQNTDVRSRPTKLSTM